MDHDIELMLQVQEENIAAFEELFRKYQKPIGNFFFRLGCDGVSCEDYTQEVFLRLWNARKNYRPTAKFTTWLFQIAKNYWLNERDKKRRRGAHMSLEETRLAGHAPADDQNGPEERILAAELQKRIQEAISGLPEKYRVVFVLSEIQDMKYQDIAEILRIPIGTVKSRMFVAERKLRKKLQAFVDA